MLKCMYLESNSILFPLKSQSMIIGMLGSCETPQWRYAVVEMMTEESAGGSLITVRAATLVKVVEKHKMNDLFIPTNYPLSSGLDS